MVYFLNLSDFYLTLISIHDFGVLIKRDGSGIWIKLTTNRKIKLNDYMLHREASQNVFIGIELNVAGNQNQTKLESFEGQHESLSIFPDAALLLFLMVAGLQFAEMT